MESVAPYIRSQSSRSMVTSQGFRFFRWNRAGAPSFMRWLSLIACSIADPHLGSSSGIHGKRIFLLPNLAHLGKLSRVFMQASLVL